jgi:hypothetical protein
MAHQQKLIVNKHKQVKKLKVVPINFLCFFNVNILVNYLISQTEHKKYLTRMTNAYFYLLLIVFTLKNEQTEKYNSK